MGRVDSVVMVTVLVAICLQREAGGAPRYQGSGGNSISPADCKFGAVRDTGNNIVCAKGPGESCDADDNLQHDLCVSGTYCHSCGICIGCTYTLNCKFDCSSTHANSIYG